MIRQFPKNSGFASLRSKMAIINLSVLEKKFSADEVIDPGKLFVAGLIRSPKTKIKVLGSGKLSKKLNISANAFSASAKEAIIKAGGEAKILNNRKTK
jgi:large subunit ribosomal protein L15